MVTRFHRWLRVVNLREWMLIAAVTSVFAIWLFERVLRWIVIWIARANASALTEAELFVPEIFPLHQFALAMLAIGYSSYRAAMFHPVGNKTYGIWLAQTPWRFPMPLPYGPVHLVWQDVAVLLAILILGLLPPLNGAALVYGPALFLTFYSGILAVIFFRLEIYWANAAFVLLAGLGSILIFHPWWCLIVSCAMYGVTYFASLSSLREFPYSEQRRVALGLVAFQYPPPLDVALPIVPLRADNWRLWLRPADAFVVGMIGGGVFFCIAFHFREAPNASDGMLKANTWIAVIAALIRVVAYIYNCRPPISFIGRLATRRLIIPGYDQVFVGPLVAVMVAMLLPQLLMLLGMAAILAVPLAVAIWVSLLLAIAPTPEQWYYTGHFRIPAVRRIGQNFVQT